MLNRSCGFPIGFGKRLIDAMPAPHHRARQRRAVSVAAIRLAQQAEIAVGRREYVGRWDAGNTAGRLVHSAAPRAAVPWLDDLPNEVHAAGDGLQDGFAGIEIGVQHARQELVDVGQRRAQPLR